LTQAGTKNPARSGAGQAKLVNGSGFASGRVPSLYGKRDDVDDRRRVQVRLRRGLQLLPRARETLSSLWNLRMERGMGILPGPRCDSLKRRFRSVPQSVT
jgi:hypothetical protein